MTSLTSTPSNHSTATKPFPAIDSKFNDSLNQAAALEPEEVDLYLQLEQDFEDYRKMCKSLEKDLPILTIQHQASLKNPMSSDVLEDKGCQTTSDLSMYRNNQE
jgi:hypothetical protein